VLFDSDGVLCRYDFLERMRLLEAALGVKAETIESQIFRSGYEDAADMGEMDAEDYLEGLTDRLGVAVTREAWLDARRRSMTPNRDMLDLARRVGERAQIAMLTGNGHLTADAFASLFPEAVALFGERCFFSARLGANKDTPEAYARLLSRLDWVADETLLIDDKPTFCDAAEQAGPQTHLFGNVEDLTADLEKRGLL
jgi:glucose-1-phosphatase